MSDEIVAAIRELIRRDTIHLTRLPGLLESYGHLEGEDDRRAKCRAIAAMVRKILKDPEVAELLERTFEVHALRSVKSLFDVTTAPKLKEAFWNEYDKRERQADKRTEELVRATGKKRDLLKFLAGKLAELKCEEGIDLPGLRDGLFPSVEYPPMPTSRS